jgi:hypothetical protein
MRNTAEENRRSWRFPTTLKGHYSLEEKKGKGKGKECRIINISLNGAGLEFYTSEPINEKTKLYLKIFSSDGNKSVSVEGTIRWIKQGKKDCVCGIQLTEKLSEDKREILKM